MTTTSTLTREQVLKAARNRHEAAVKAEIDKLQLAVEWAELNPGDVVDETRSWEERDLEVAGDGAPTVAEFSIAEFSLAVGMSTDAGRVYIGDAVELCHRLPRLWARVMDAEVPLWKARKFAQQTKSLPVDAAAFVTGRWRRCCRVVRSRRSSGPSKPRVRSSTRSLLRSVGLRQRRSGT